LKMSIRLDNREEKELLARLNASLAMVLRFAPQVRIS